ncbi:DSD1 family PLP-dependent enzyme [Ketogulonicigenium vulgare]|uniref:DSD1 family PLP-dependent enzyme n=1 Tax=Ketogulonicigenium vulgare TaxID=92945 RepID=UPI002359788F|nr:DSD1 family PLP-dependent enzyme [Ketogulonicigenium vulgare]
MPDILPHVVAAPARIGDPAAMVDTPALVIDLDVFDANIARMKAYAAQMGVALRPHAKTHKSADIALLQMQQGGAVGVCCQKVSEAVALADAGVTDILIANEVVGPAKVAALAALAGRIKLAVCADHLVQVAAYSAAAAQAGVTLDVLVEIDCGSHRCGVQPGQPAVDLALAIDAAPNLHFAGLQSYFGRAQHIYDAAERRAALEVSLKLTADTRDAIRAAGLTCDRVTGAGTGTYGVEGASGVYTEIQPGSYVFMDADYNRVAETGGFAQSLHVVATVLSTSPGQAVCDAGLKASATDCGPPQIAWPKGVTCGTLSDEHGNVVDPDAILQIGDRVGLIPGHIDPTCNLHDWYVGVRGGVVETLWPVTARGRLF